MLATAESCTGGLIAKLCTDLSGSSTWFERGFVTYSNSAKSDMLGVNLDLIEQQGAVSEPVARAMAEGAIKKSQAHWSVAVTGIAGPTGGSKLKPVGLVWFAWSNEEQTISHNKIFEGDREMVREQTAEHGIAVLTDLIMRTK